MTKNTIAFQKGFIIPVNAGVDNQVLVMTVQAEFMNLGYMLNEEAYQALRYADAADIKDLSNEVIPFLLDLMGGSRNYKPIYPGFPQQVMEMSDYQLWANQIIGYWSGGSFTAEEYPEIKGKAFEFVNYKMIGLGTEDTFSKIFTSLLSAGQSITPADMKVVEWFLKNYPTLVFPSVIPFKENLCTVLGYFVKNNISIDKIVAKLTTTDVLRTIVYLSGGDISLPAVPQKTIRTSRWSSNKIPNPERQSFKFKKFKRPERKIILGLLEKSNLDIREMKLKKERWIRVGEILHPGQYSQNFPNTFKAFHKLRNEKVVSWYGEVEKAFNQSFDVGLHKLSERPGEFLRRLDYLVRNMQKSVSTINKILKVLGIVGEKSSNKVLFEVYEHFENRRNPVKNRSIMIKGARKRTKLPDLPAINSEIVDLIQTSIWDIFKTKLSKLEPMGTCWIDEQLKNIPLPTNMRSLNDTLVPIIRGQRIPLASEKKVIRSFIHWFDERGTRDIDLHGFLLSDKISMSFGYNGIRVSEIGCYSGDVLWRQGACAEYVDIDVDTALKHGYQYYLMVAHNFEQGKLSDIKECVVGVMEREYPEANSHWLPTSLVNTMKVEGASNMCLVFAYDLSTREYIHLDLDFNKLSGYVNGQVNEFWKVISYYLVPPTLSVYDLVKWHVEARGTLVTKELAETHFLFEDFSSSYLKTIELMGV